MSRAWISQVCPLRSLATALRLLGLLALLMVVPVQGATAPAVVITPASSAGAPRLTSETGNQALVSVVLATLPSGNVQVQLSNPAPGEISLSSTTLNFTVADWNQAQLVTITGLADGLVDGDQLVNVAVTVNAPATNYAGVVVLPIVVENLDADIPGLTLAASPGTTVIQEGGTPDTVTVALAAQPATNVTVTASTDGQFVVSPATLTFTNGNWSSPQTVTLTAVDDHLVNGTRNVQVSFAATGSGYDGTTDTLPVTILDNDVAGVEVTPLNGLITSEAGLQAQVHLRLTSQPTADVVVPLSSSNLAEGTVSPASLTFTSQNWNSYQSVTLTGVPDGIADSDQSWTMITGLTSSSDSAYNLLNPANASVLNRNSDLATLVVTPGTVEVNQGGTTANIQVVLSTRPVSNVTVTVVSSDVAQATVSTASLVFTSGISGNWNTPQTVVVTGQPSGSSGNQSFTVTCTPSGDAAYAALVPVVVTGTNRDLSQPTVLLGPLSPAIMTEGSGVSASYTVRLSSDPGPGNTITVTPTPTPNENQLVVTSAAVLTFDHINFAWPQTVTVLAVDDSVARGFHSSQILQVVSGSSYQSVTLAIPVIDSNQVGIIATPTTGLTTTQLGGTATFTVRLASKPTGLVNLPLTCSDSQLATVSPTSLNFTPTGATAWNLPQIVTVTGADGYHRFNGDVPYQVSLGPALSGDGLYAQLVGTPVEVVNHWVNLPPTLAAISDVQTNEDSGTQIVALSGISDGGEGEGQTVTITAVSSNPALTGPVSITYANPATTGTLALTLATHVFGNATITVAVSDGVTTVQRQFHVLVAWVNVLPTVTRNTSLVVGYRGTGAYQGFNANNAAPGQLLASDVETATSALIYHLILAPTGGFVTRNGVQLANGDTFTQAQIDAGLLTYTHDGAVGTQDGFVVQVEDGDGGLSSTVVVSVNIDRSVPAVDLLPAGTVTWSEGDAPVAIASGSQVTDPNVTNFNLGWCAITLSTGGRSGDVLAVRHVGDGANQIGVNGAIVSWGGVAFGTWTGGTWPTALTITFNANATPAVTQALLRQITFTNTTRDPGAIQRIVQVVINDGVGHASPPQPRTIVTVPQNDAPLAIPVAVTTVTDVDVSGHLLVDDPDGPTATYALVSQPTRGRITAFVPTTGAFTYQPDPGESGTDQFTFTVSDGFATSAPGTVTVYLTGAETPHRLWISSDAPLEVQAGSTLSWTLRTDLSELDPTTDLQFRLENAPVGMQIQTDAATGTALISWPNVVGTGPIRFRVRVWDAISHTGDVQSVVLLVHPLPGGGG